MGRAQKLLLVASDDDGYSLSSVRALREAKSDAELHELRNAGHGTTMLERELGFFSYVVEWIANNVR
jgi:pimeloyl-ACP methyl ester carboxylesterase